MTQINPDLGLSTLVNHVGEGENPLHAHVMPIYQTSTFSFPDVETGAAIFKGEAPGYIYTRLSNPNLDQLAHKIAVLEGLDLLRQEPEKPDKEIVGGMVFSSGMAAVSSAVLARTQAGQTIIAQESLYGTTFTLLSELAPRYGIKVVWLKDTSPDQWERAFSQNPEAVAAYIETPVNPTMAVVDIARISEIAHRYGAWVIVDNTFATPFCQRPLTLGADVVVHSTTKYISGHGLTIGGAVVSRHVNFINNELNGMLKMLGGVCSPMDAWLANNGLKTFELRMQRHCDNGLQIARYLEQHPAVEHVYYPGLPGHPDHELAKRQMLAFGGMLSFELKGGLRAGEDLMNRIKVMTLAVSLGNVDTLIQHPASMSHSNVPREVRIKAGLSDGLVRLSVGIENCEDLIADFEQAFGN